MTQTSRTDSAIDALMALHPKGYDLSLDRIRALLARLGEPQRAMPPVIHVAGTNGKGSTIAFARAALEAAGLRVHVHTSPHLVRWHERYRLGKPGGGLLAPDDLLADAIGRVAKANGGAPITVFEILSAAMFVLFSEQPADVALVEVGLGGRFDATNVLETAAVSVIAPIGLDHRMHLGDTLGAIAFEKAGILRRDVPGVIAHQEREALDVIRARAQEVGAPLRIAGEDYEVRAEHGRLVYTDGDGLLDLPMPVMAGEHQTRNAATAIAACRAFAGERIGQAAAERAMMGAAWPARLQRLREGALIDRLPDAAEVWLDGGHNGHAGAALARFMEGRRAVDARALTLIVGMLDTKEPVEFLAPFLALRPRVLAVPVTGSESGIPAAALAAKARALTLEAEAFDTLPEAVEAIAARGDAGRVLMCGSLYLAGEVLARNGTPPR